MNLNNTLTEKSNNKEIAQNLVSHLIEEIYDQYFKCNRVCEHKSYYQTLQEK